MKDLTRAEEEVMQVLWDLNRAFVREIRDRLPGEPAYNTVSTIVRILQDKGLVSHQKLGKSHQYYPLVSREEYSQHKMQGLVRGYFDGSYSKLVSFFVGREELDTKELDAILKIIEANKKP